MTRDKFAERFGYVFLVATHLLLIGLLIICYFAGGFLVYDVTGLAVLAPIFGVFTTAVLRDLLRGLDEDPQRRKTHEVSGALVRTSFALVLAFGA